MIGLFRCQSNDLDGRKNSKHRIVPADESPAVLGPLVQSGMGEFDKPASLHFQILAFGTLIFLVVFFGYATPSDYDRVIAGYLAFVVLVASHGLFANGTRRDERDKRRNAPDDKPTDSN